MRANGAHFCDCVVRLPYTALLVERRPDMRIWSVVSALLLIAGAIAPAHAQVIAGDDPVFGPGSIAIDLSTGYEWLSPQFSTNRSIADVSSQFGPGGDFEGFRYATQAELVAFWQSAGLSTGFGHPTAAYEAFLALMGGPTEANSSVQRIVANVSTEAAPNAFYAPDVGIFFGSGFANPFNCCISSIRARNVEWNVKNVATAGASIPNKASNSASGTAIRSRRARSDMVSPYSVTTGLSSALQASETNGSGLRGVMSEPRYSPTK